MNISSLGTLFIVLYILAAYSQGKFKLDHDKMIQLNLLSDG